MYPTTTYIDLEQRCIAVLRNNPCIIRKAFAITIDYINRSLDSLHWNTARAYVDRCFCKLYVFDGVSKTIDAPNVFSIQLCMQLMLYKVPFSFTSNHERLICLFKRLFKRLADRTFDRSVLLTAYNYRGTGSDHLRKNLFKSATCHACTLLTTNQNSLVSTNPLCTSL